jgi:hypothetical protein
MSESSKLKWKLEEKNIMTGSVAKHPWVYGINPRKGRTCMLAIINLKGGNTEHIICSTKSQALEYANHHYLSTLSE